MKISDLPPDEVGEKLLALIRNTLGLTPGCKIMVLIDAPLNLNEADGPAAIFSEMSYNRAVDLVNLSLSNLLATRDQSVRVIAKAMLGVKHG